MITVGHVLQYLETLAPRSMKMEWDNVGLLCGSARQEVSKVLVALDPFENVCAEAAEIGAQLIVTHHPLIFTAPRAVTDETAVGRCIMSLCRNSISAINAHTNLDCAPEGVNDVLAATVGLENIEVIAPTGVAEDGRPWGLLRMGEVPQQPLADFLTHVKAALKCDGLRYVSGGKDVHKVAVGGGACAGELKDAVASGCDTFITADVRYNQFWDAHDLGINLIDAGHFCTENPVVALLAEKIQAQFPEIQVVVSKKHEDCMKFF